MNTYGSVDNLKTLLDITGTGDDALLRLLLERASRAADNWLGGRYFFARTQTRYFRGKSTRLFIDDLLSVTTLKSDEDGDGTFETTFATTDYELFPLNDFPKTWIEVSDNTAQGGFSVGVRKAIEIDGLWGFGTGDSATPYVTATETVNGSHNATTTTLAVNTRTDIEAGHTILVATEQMYVVSYSGNNLTVERGVNGTTAASQSDAAAISIYEYPEAIIQAVHMQASRWWQRRNTSFGEQVGDPAMGQFQVSRGLDPDIRALLKYYRAWKIA